MPPVAPQGALGRCRECGMLRGVRGAHPAQPPARLAASLPGLGCARERRIISRSAGFEVQSPVWRVGRTPGLHNAALDGPRTAMF